MNINSLENASTSSSRQQMNAVSWYISGITVKPEYQRAEENFRAPRAKMIWCSLFLLTVMASGLAQQPRANMTILLEPRVATVSSQRGKTDQLDMVVAVNRLPYIEMRKVEDDSSRYRLSVLAICQYNPHSSSKAYQPGNTVTEYVSAFLSLDLTFNSCIPIYNLTQSFTDIVKSTGVSNDIKYARFSTAHRGSPTFGISADIGDYHGWVSALNRTTTPDSLDCQIHSTALNTSGGNFVLKFLVEANSNFELKNNAIVFPGSSATGVLMWSSYIYNLPNYSNIFEVTNKHQTLTPVHGASLYNEGEDPIPTQHMMTDSPALISKTLYISFNTAGSPWYISVSSSIKVPTTPDTTYNSKPMHGGGGALGWDWKVTAVAHETYSVHSIQHVFENQPN
ncbi:hypothetical protein PROFUN_02967 [Planoprotostelium fungivorum]|uniref:Uncharacterized protein n=1 Tax=Planoprotostelium fungivorum TaxID=1890364 RepID=A0A2P6NX94_9EUKA|nr:hypothetical protein PROFUN_02967 [Planoprotostelium fungivorum]